MQIRRMAIGGVLRSPTDSPSYHPELDTCAWNCSRREHGMQAVSLPQHAPSPPAVQSVRRAWCGSAQARHALEARRSSLSVASRVGLAFARRGRSPRHGSRVVCPRARPFGGVPPDGAGRRRTCLSRRPSPPRTADPSWSRRPGGSPSSLRCLPAPPRPFRSRSSRGPRRRAMRGDEERLGRALRRRAAEGAWMTGRGLPRPLICSLGPLDVRRRLFHGGIVRRGPWQDPRFGGPARRSRKRETAVV